VVSMFRPDKPVEAWVTIVASEWATIHTKKDPVKVNVLIRVARRTMLPIRVGPWDSPDDPCGGGLLYCRLDAIEGWTLKTGSLQDLVFKASLRRHGSIATSTYQC